MADIFNKSAQEIKAPITADLCTLTIDNEIVADAIQFQCNYSQPINRRRAIGNQVAILYGGMPSGSISISRLITGDSSKILGSKIFSCTGGEISFSGEACEGGGSIRYKARGAMVSNFSLSASADDLTVMDNITVEFLELSTS